VWDGSFDGHQSLAQIFVDGGRDIGLRHGGGSEVDLQMFFQSSSSAEKGRGCGGGIKG
jgi:hypothetical protein